MPYPLFLIILLISLISSGINALPTEDCMGYQKIKGYTLNLPSSCLGLVANKTHIPWSKPRKIMFLNEDTLLITDMDRWGGKKGKLWALNIKTLKYRIIYSGGRQTHGLAIDHQKRILIGNSNEILRQNKNNFEPIIKNLPVKGKHPLSQFIVLPNNDIIINIGAPSDHCEEDLRGSYCPSRDQTAELRHYFYQKNTDSYSSHYHVIARGLRNSMALIYNPLKRVIYQAENNIDLEGIVEEFNIIPLEKTEPLDFGWPFCYGFKQQTFNNQKLQKFQLQNLFGFFCKKKAASPFFNIPPHSSPLDMVYYFNHAFPELQNTLLMTWHGHRRSDEQALIAYELNDQMSPPLFSPSQQPYIPILSGKNISTGEKIRPVGVTVDSSGHIWFVDDKSSSLYVLAPSQASDTQQTEDDSFSDQNLQLIEKLSQEQIKSFYELYDRFYSAQNCTNCHSESSFPPDAQGALHSLLNKRWIIPNTPVQNMPLIDRMHPKQLNSPKAMPFPKPFGLSHKEIFQDFQLWLSENISSI